ncbi:MAG: metallophosphoesterase [Methanoregula sp.]|nr:metallophosphoesterase [Methanoregula sp.]
MEQQNSKNAMGAVIFSDVHADAEAIAALLTCIRNPSFVETFGPIDRVINLGDILHRGDHPKEALENIHTLSGEYKLISVLGNHDHAFLHGLFVSGSDAGSLYRHEQLRDSPLLSIFEQMPMEWSDNGMLFVHGGPMELGQETLRLKCWQRLSHQPGDSFSGYRYTADMAFDTLQARGLTHLCCGHQHTHICCRKTPQGVVQHPIEFLPLPQKNSRDNLNLEVARIPLDLPTINRVGSCHGSEPEFAYTDYSTFSFIRIV